MNAPNGAFQSFFRKKLINLMQLKRRIFYKFVTCDVQYEMTFHSTNTGLQLNRLYCFY